MFMKSLGLTLTLAIALITFGYTSPSFAGKKCDADPTHPSCKDDTGGGGGGGGGDTDPALYIVEWSGDVEGNNEGSPWAAVNKKRISLGIGAGPPSKDRNAGQLTDLSFFTKSGSQGGPFEGDDGFNCLGESTEFGLLGGFLQRGTINKGRHGRAELTFGFLGYTKTPPDEPTDSDRIHYTLHLNSAPGITFDSDWPPTTTEPTTVTVSTWELHTVGIDDMSCSGSGDLGFLVNVTVTLL